MSDGFDDDDYGYRGTEVDEDEPQGGRVSPQEVVARLKEAASKVTKKQWMIVVGSIVGLIVLMIASNAIKAAIGDAGADDSLPHISAVTQGQQDEAASAAATPALSGLDAPPEWGENQATLWVDRQTAGPWRAFYPGEYDYEGARVPTLAGIWVLRAPTGSDGRSGAVVAVVTIRPHGFVRDDTGSVWGYSVESADAGLRHEDGIAEWEVAQDERLAVDGLNARLISGYGEDPEGANRGWNFSYVTVDDGAFFTTFRLAGDPDYFPDYTDEFLRFVTDTDFDA